MCVQGQQVESEVEGQQVESEVEGQQVESEVEGQQVESEVEGVRGTFVEYLDQKQVQCSTHKQKGSLVCPGTAIYIYNLAIFSSIFPFLAQRVL